MIDPFQFTWDSTTAIYFHILVYLATPFTRFTGSDRGCSCSPKVVNSALLEQFLGNVIPGTICGDPTIIKSTSTTKTREGVREVFLSQGSNGEKVLFATTLYT